MVTRHDTIRSRVSIDDFALLKGKCEFLGEYIFLRSVICFIGHEIDIFMFQLHHICKQILFIVLALCFILRLL